MVERGLSNNPEYLGFSLMMYDDHVEEGAKAFLAICRVMHNSENTIGRAILHQERETRQHESRAPLSEFPVDGEKLDKMRTRSSGGMFGAGLELEFPSS